MLCPHQLKEEFLWELLDIFGGDAWHIVNQSVVQGPVDAQPMQRILRQRVFVQPPEPPGGNLLKAVPFVNKYIDNFVLEIDDFVGFGEDIQIKA